MRLNHPLAALNALIGIVLGALAVVAIVTALWWLADSGRGVAIVAGRAEGIPVTVFRPADGPPGPAIVIAHGFAGSQQLMRPFALTLAGNGYTAVTFDFPGHGANLIPMPGPDATEDARNGALQAALATVKRYVRALPGAGPRIGLLGHSMATDIVVRQAADDPDVVATVGVSLFSPAVTTGAPRNLLVIDGALEVSMLRDEAERVVAMVAGGPAQPDTTYGDFAAGTARRFTVAPGVEHIAVLYSLHSLDAARAWFDEAFGRHGGGAVAAQGSAIGLLFLGLLLLARPLEGLLPRAASLPLGAGLPWRRFAPVAIAPAGLTPLLLWRLPTDFMPILLGDYLTVHFAVYGLLTAAGTALAGGFARRHAIVYWRGLALATLAVGAYLVFAFGVPIDHFLTAFTPRGVRLELVPVVFVGTLIYFAANEWLTRGPGAARFGYAASKLFFVASLMGAVALNLHRLFFLIIIIPVMLVFLFVYGLFASWAYRRTFHPLVGAIANAVALALAIAATFPLID